MNEKSVPASGEINLAWGVTAISKCIKRDRRGTYYLLEKGLLPGAFKVGGTWCLNVDMLRAAFSQSGEAA